MRRVVRGRTYDTGTAERIAEASEGFPGESEHYHETLYRTRGNALFLACVGEASSPYATLLRDGLAKPGGDVVPLSDAEALRWLEDHEETAAIERLFGTMPEAGDGRVVVWAGVTTELQDRIADAAEAAGQDIEAWLAEAIASALPRR